MRAPIRPALLVGLTGGIGSGKTTVANLFAAQGVPLVDTDVIAHDLTGPGGAAMPAIEREFGRAVIAPDGRLDRAAMRALAFSDPGSRKRLEAILHPMIGQETDRRIAAAASAPNAIVVIPLLVEGGRWADWLDRVLVVDCPEDEQVRRVGRRSGLGEREVRSIMATQLSRRDRLARADDVLDNAGPPEAIPPAVARLDRSYRALAAARSDARP